MLHVLGAGSFFPATKISNSLLGELLGSDFVAALAASTGITTRYSSLPESYLRGTSDTSLNELRKLPGASPTDLAYFATLEACSRAGISPSQLSALIADCCTPFQVTPSEAQRLGERFKLKIPSFDLMSSTGPIPGQLEALMSWQESRVPEYTLLAATNTPTHRINYRCGNEAFYFGDGAGALVVSTRHPGKLLVKEAESFHATAMSGVISFDKFEFAILPDSSASLIYDLALEAGEKAITKSGKLAAEVKFIGPEFTAKGDETLARKLGISPQNHWTLVSERGNSLSSSSVVTLSNYWDKAEKGDVIVCVGVGVGLSYGYIIFECVR